MIVSDRPTSVHYSKLRNTVVPFIYQYTLTVVPTQLYSVKCILNIQTHRRRPHTTELDIYIEITTFIKELIHPYKFTTLSGQGATSSAVLISHF